MKLLSHKNLRVGALVTAVVFGVILVSSPAFSWDRRASWPHYRYPSHSRIVVHDSFIPGIIATGIIAGLTFSLIDSAINAPAPPYVTATQPSASVYGNPNPQVASSGTVMVTAQLLNVRSGPGLGNPAIRQIPNGTMLSICGSAPGWYYVKTADNLYGWVMTQFTAPVGYSAAG